VTPATTLNSDGLPTPSINNPWGILFDASGNMWFTNEQLTPPTGDPNGTVVEFTATSIAGGGVLTLAPNVTLHATAVGGTTSFGDPNGISMNSAGNITVANAGNSSLGGIHCRPDHCHGKSSTARVLRWGGDDADRTNRVDLRSA
jgi:hypothetical protein